MRTAGKLVLGVALSLVAGSPLLAHHEWPVDQTKRITLQGTVTAFTWANPHVMIALDGAPPGHAAQCVAAARDTPVAD